MTEKSTYDPVSATVLRLGMPGGDEFFQENLDSMREVYGDKVTDALRSAYAEDDLSRAEEFASLVVPAFSYHVVDDAEDRLEIRYAAGEDIKGSLSLMRTGVIQGDPLVLAVLKASSGIASSMRARPASDQEIIADRGI